MNCLEFSPTKPLQAQLYAQIDQLEKDLKHEKVLNDKLQCSNPLSVFNQISLSDIQKYHLENLLALNFSVFSHEKNLYFHISLSKIILKIKEIVLEIPGLEVQDIMLVGSAAGAVFESDPKIFAKIVESLTTGVSPKEIEFSKFDINDLDIRIYLIGGTKAKRRILSSKLVSFYAQLASQQQTELIASKVTDLYMASRKDSMINFLQNQFLSLLKKTHPKENESKLIQIARKKAVYYDTKKNALQHKIILENLICYFKNPQQISFPLSLKRKINDLLDTHISQSIFSKLNNTPTRLKPNMKDHFLIQSLSLFELIFVESIERDYNLTPDALQFSLVNFKLKPREIIHRMLRKVGSHPTIYAIDFLKFANYFVQGFDAISTKEVQNATKAFVAAFKNDPRFVLEFFDNHVKRGNSLKALVFLFNCSSILESLGHHTERIELMAYLKPLLSNTFAKSWEHVLQGALLAKKISWEDFETLLQGIGAIYLFNKSTGTVACELFVRESSDSDVENKIMNVAIRGKDNPYSYYFLRLSYDQNKALKDTLALVYNSEKMHQLFHLLYEMIVQDQKDPILQIVELLKTAHVLGHASDRSNDLWLKTLEEPTSDAIKDKVLEEAEKIGLFKTMAGHETILWNHAPLKNKKESISTLLKSNQSSLAWSLLEMTVQNSPDQAMELFKKISNDLLNSDLTSKDLAWNHTQLLTHLHTFVRNKELVKNILLRGFKKCVEASILFPEWRSVANKWTEHFLNESIAPHRSIMSGLPTLQSYLPHFVLQQSSSSRLSLESVLKRYLPAILSILREENRGLLIFELLNSGMQIPNLLGLNLKTVQCVLVGFEAKLAEGKLLEVSLKTLLKVIPKIPDVLNKAGITTDHPFWEDLRRLYLTSLKLKNWDLSEIIERTFIDYPQVNKEFSKAKLQEIEQTIELKDWETVYQLLSFNKETSPQEINILEMQQFAEQCVLELIKSTPLTSKVQHVISLLKRYPQISPQSLLRLLDSLSETSDESCQKEILHRSEQYLWKSEFWKENNALWSLCISKVFFLRKGNKEESLKECLMHFEEVKALTEFSEFNFILESAFKQLTSLNSRQRKDEVILNKLKSLRECAQKTISIVSSPGWIAIDLELCELYLEHDSFILHGLEKLETLMFVTFKISSIRKIESLLERALKLSSQLGNEKLTTLLPTIVRLYNFSKKFKEWKWDFPILINTLSASVHPFHEEVIDDLMTIHIDNNHFLNALSREALLKFIQKTQSSPVQVQKWGERVGKLFTKSCTDSFAFEDCALKWIEHSWASSNIKKDLMKVIGTLPARFCRNPRVVAILLREVRELWRQSFIEEADELLNSYVTPMIEPIESIHGIPYSLKEEDQQHCCLGINEKSIKPLVYISKTLHHSDTETFNFLISLFISLFESIGNTFPDRTIPSQSRAYLLDLSYAILFTLTPSKMSPEIYIKIFDRLVYLCDPEDTQFFTLHVTRKMSTFAYYASHDYRLFDKYKEKLHEYFIYFGANYPASLFVGIPSLEISYKHQTYILHSVITRLVNKNCPAALKHAFLVFAESSKYVLTNDPTGLLTCFQELIPTIVNNPNYKTNNVSVLGLFEDFQTIVPDPKKFASTPEDRKITVEYFYESLEAMMKICDSEDLPDLENGPFILSPLDTIAYMRRIVFENYSQEYGLLITTWSSQVISYMNNHKDQGTTFMDSVFDMITAKELVKTKADARARVEKMNEILFLIGKNSPECLTLSSGLFFLAISEGIYDDYPEAGSKVLKFLTDAGVNVNNYSVLSSSP